jgi:hypothetical protein
MLAVLRGKPEQAGERADEYDAIERVVGWQVHRRT